MTKTFISIFLVSFSFHVFACKPMPLPKCAKLSMKVDYQKLEKLRDKIYKFEGIVDQKIIEPKDKTSCFNSHFAGYFTHNLVEELRATKGKTCREQTGRVWEYISGELSTEGTLQYIKDEKALEDLNKLAKEITKDAKALSLY